MIDISNLKDGDKINHNGEEYIVINKNGKISLKQYDNEFKMWITLHFVDKQDSKLEERLIKTLSNEYIKKAILEG